MLFKNLIYSIQGRLVGPFSFWYFVHDDLMRTFRELGTKQITWKLIDLPAPTWATAKENLENTKTLICCHNRGARARAFVLLIDILVAQGVSYTGQIVLMLWLNSIYQIYDVKKLLLNFSHWQMFCVYCMLCVSYSRMCKLWWRHWIRIWSRISFLPSQEKRSEDDHSHVSAFIFYLRTCTDFYFSLFVLAGSSSSTTGWRCLLWK